MMRKVDPVVVLFMVRLVWFPVLSPVLRCFVFASQRMFWVFKQRNRGCSVPEHRRIASMWLDHSSAICSS